jgi:hypothetical protein
VRLSAHNRQRVAVWLSAILLLLSFAASSHSLTHLNDGVGNHCTLCFHQDQLNKLLPVQAVMLPSVSPVRESYQSFPACLTFRHIQHYQSRAPPVSH